jgi:quercetin dioxygenase-like cupin family protein
MSITNDSLPDKSPNPPNQSPKSPMSPYTSKSMKMPSKKGRIDHLVPVTDHVPIGTPLILQSPHVSEGPGRIANSPVPSIYNDDRGEIHRLRVGHRRVNLMYSKAGVMRSGYLHPHSMKHFVVSGSVEVWTLGQEQTEKKVQDAGSYFTVEPYIPHILHFLEDTISLEFWDGEFSCYYYHPYRRVVQLQNSLVEDKNSRQTGSHQHLVPQDTPESSSTTPAVLWWTSGLVLGIAVGVFIGINRRK